MTSDWHATCDSRGMARSKAASVGVAVDVASLRRIGKNQLLRAFSKVVTEDRSNTAAMLAYIGEIDRRKLYLEDSYPSMFALCTRHFGMSESIAGKRIRAGRAACRFPRILEMIRRGDLHLSGVHQLAAYLTEQNHEEVLERATRRSMREIDLLIAEISPQPDRASVIRELSVEAEGSEGTDVEGTEGSVRRDLVPANSLRNLTIPLSPRRYRLHVTIGQLAKDALEELQGLLSHQIPNGDPALVVEQALVALLRDTKKKRAALAKRPRAPKKLTKKTRMIPAHVRRAVFERDGGRCTFVDGEGNRCDSAWQVEFHHCVPFGRDGPHTLDNVELRCRAHNQYEAELEYGKRFMAKRRESA